MSALVIRQGEIGKCVFGGAAYSRAIHGPRFAAGVRRLIWTSRSGWHASGGLMRFVTRIGTLVLAVVALGFGWHHFRSAEPTMSAQADEVPTFEFDPTWPRLPLPNNWIFGNIAAFRLHAQDPICAL